jgi:hypothetical protein
MRISGQLVRANREAQTSGKAVGRYHRETGPGRREGSFDWVPNVFEGRARLV